MSYIVLYIRHSGPSLFSRANAASQYGDPDVAATAILQGHFVRVDGSPRRVPPASLPLPAPSPKQPRAAAGAGSQSGFHGQAASSADPSGPSALPPAAPDHQPSGGRSAAAVAGTPLLPWLRPSRKLLGDASYTTMRIVMLQRSWRRCSICWRRRAPS